MLSNQELREFSRVNPWQTICALSVDWFLICAGFALAIEAPHPLIWIFCFLLIARAQLALAIMMHDAAHKRLFSSVQLNDFTGQWLCAAPLLFSMFSYRTLHLKHHQDPLVETDPDISLIGGYPISRKSFTRKLLRDALGISYFKFIRYFIHMARRTKSHPSTSTPEAGAKRAREKVPLRQIIFSILIMNALIFAAVAASGHPVYYFSLWLLPAVTALQVLLRIRGIAEHAGYQPNENQMLNARTVKSSWQTLIFAPHHVNYHIEHHIYPSIPHYHLSKVHKIMDERGVLPEANVYPGYGKVIREIVK
jgi:fatty acid desaturase